MFTRILAISAAVAIILAATSTTRAQNRGGGTSAFGSSGFGSSGFGSSGFGGGSSSMGRSSGFGSSGFGSSGFGNSGFGSSGFGNSGFGNSGFGNSGFGNSGFGNSGFGGGQNGGGQQFVGRDSTDMQNAFQQTNRAQNQFFNNMNRQMSRQNQSQRKNTSTVQNPPQPMRMEVRVAFTPPSQSSQVVANTLRARLAKILGDHGMSQPVLTMQGDTAVLTGAAASDSERQVIGQLVALEQGVRGVRNEMTVAGEASASAVQ